MTEASAGASLPLAATYPGGHGLDKVLANLRAPFPARKILWRVGARTPDGKQGQAIPYLDARDIQDRLDEVVGPQNWKSSFVDLREGVRCLLSIKCGTEWVAKEDAASQASVSERDVNSMNRRRDLALREAHSDAFFRAAVAWGIGRYLFAYDAPWAELSEAQALAIQPKLPRHMLPESDHEDASSVSGYRPLEVDAGVNQAELKRSQVPATAALVSPSTPVNAQTKTPTAFEASLNSSEPPIGNQEQWNALSNAERNSVTVIVERIRRGTALHSIDEYLKTGSGKALPEWLRTELTVRLAEKRRSQNTGSAVAAGPTAGSAVQTAA